MPLVWTSSYPEIILNYSLDKGQSYYGSSDLKTFFDGRIITNGEEYWDVKEL